MASFDSSGWPSGATVTVYARDAFGNATGSSVTSATASAAGVASFSGLADSGKYVATDGSRTVKFGTPPTSASSERRGVFDVTKGPYNAAGDGVTDDRAAIQAAVDACKAAGGGLVYFPAGTYRIVSQGSAAYGIFVDGSNIALQGAGPASIIKGESSGGQGRTFVLGGSSLPNGRANWITNRITNVAVLPISPAVKGARTVTLTTPGDAAGFPVGAWAFIRTGQCIGTAGAGQTTEPDSEINQIVAANPATGVLTFRWPLAKDYAQEYYQSGTSGATTTTVTANPAPLGVANVSDRVTTNISFRNFGLADTSQFYVITGEGVVGLTIEDITGTYNQACLSFGGFRKVWLRRLDLHGNGGGDITYNPVAFAKASGDVWMNDLLLSSDGLTQFHIAEGTFRHFARSLVVTNNPNTTVANDVLNFSGRGYDLDYDDIDVYGSSSSALAHAISQTADVKGPLHLGQGVRFHDPFVAGTVFRSAGVRYQDRPSRSGLYYSQCIESSGAGILVQNNLSLSPLTLESRTRFVEVAMNCIAATAANVLRCGIYADNNGWPYQLVAEFPATFDLSTTGVKSQVIDLTLEAGDYWMGGVLQGGAGSSVSNIGPNGDTSRRMPRAQSPAASPRSIFLPGVTGALPAQFTATVGGGAISNLGPMLTLKAA